MTIAAVLIASVLLSQCDDNQSLPNRAARRELSAEEAAAVAAEARGAVDAFLEAWNTGSSAELAEVVGFPFVTLRGDGRVRIDGSSETFQPRYFERIRETEQWHHSTYDAIEPVWVFDNKVHFKVQWSRYNTNGERYANGEVLFVVPKVDETWRVRARSSIAPPQPQDEAIAAEARGAVDAFLEAWNTGCSEAVSDVVRFPFVTLGVNSPVTITETPEEFLPGLFERIREKDHWDHSTFDEIEPVWVSENRVHFRVQWSRHNTDGEKYVTGDILYTTTKVDDEWRIQVRSPLSRNRRLQ